jgi:hypothetical protein
MNAYMNHGRWVADCVTGCGGAERVHADGKLQVSANGVVYGITSDGRMVCGSCGEESLVVFPEEMPLIEAAMEVRKMRNRNWVPGESVGRLLDDNVDNGLAVA